MNNSYFYNQIDVNSCVTPQWIKNLEKYSEEKSICVYIFRYPIVDNEHETYEQNYLLMIPGHKLCLIQESEDSYFDEYKEDVIASISYLYQKYDFRTTLGLFTKIKQELITSEKINSLLNINVNLFLEKIKLLDSFAKRKAEILISLCVGSINDIKRIGLEVPQTLVEKVRKKIQLFDGDQTRFIYKNENKRIIKIQGLSGTGKTELLLHKLKELYTLNDECKIFFTCHNKVLASSLKERIQQFFNFMKVQKQIEWEKRLWCANAWGRSYDFNSGLYRYICYYYNLSYYPYHFSKSFEQLCKIALDELKKVKDFKPVFDYIIVDESQDFDNNFIELCKYVTSKQVYMAGDIFQSIFAEHIAKDYDADYLLGKCYRTAPDTLMFAHALGLGLFENTRYRWLKDEDWKTCGYSVYKNNNKMTLFREPTHRFEGDDITYKSVKLYNSEISKIADDICILIQEMKDENNNQLKPDDIAIIFIDDSKSIYTIANQIEMAIQDKFDWKINKAYETKEKRENSLFLTNRNNVKGLEFPYVICITDKIQNEYVYRNSIYTMLTRSFLRSYLVFTQKDYKINFQIENGLQQIETEHKMTIDIPSISQISDIEVEFKKAKQALSAKELVDKYIYEHKLGLTEANKIIGMLQVMGTTGLSESEVMEKIESIANIIK